MLVAVDAGGIKTTGWATSVGTHGHNLELLGAEICEQLRKTRVVLAIEAPLWIPLRNEQLTMTAARRGERISWAGRVGGGVLAAGLANLSVILRTAKPARVVFDETSAVGHLVVLEAYRPSAGADHLNVAEDILKALMERWPDGFKNRVTRNPDEPVLNLVSCLASALEIATPPLDLRRETKVIDPSKLD